MKTIEQQIELFKEQTDFQLDIKDGKPYYDGNIYFFGSLDDLELLDNLVVNGDLIVPFTNITELPKGLVVKGDLNIANTNITKLPKGLVVKGNLDISYTPITELPSDIFIGESLLARYSFIEKLPDNLAVKGDLDISYTPITELPSDIFIGEGLLARYSPIEKLPDNLNLDYLVIDGTKITELPKRLVVKGNLYITYTEIKKLPEDIVIGGSLFANNSSLEKLPINLKVGGDLDLQDSIVKELPSGLEVGDDIYVSEYIKDSMTECEFNHLNNLLLNDSYKKDYIEWAQETTGRKFCIVDDLFTEILEEKGNVKKVKQLDDEHEELYLVTDGNGNYAHGYTIQEAKADLIYKISNRDKSDYKGLTLDSTLTHEEAIKCYRVITGACSAGTKCFVENMLGDKRKDEYTIQEMIDLTKGQFGNEEFVKFFKS